MLILSQDDRSIIARYPLGNSLDHLRDPLRKVEQTYQQVRSLTMELSIAPTKEPPTLIPILLNALLTQGAALDLRSKTGNADIASKLFTLFRRVKRVRNGDFNYEHYRPLSRLIVENAPDTEIWSAVFNLMTALSYISRPASIAPSFNSTPITHSSASQQSSEQTGKLFEPLILHEIRNCTHTGVEGFFEKYFEGKTWTKRSREIHAALKNRYADGRWTDFPDPPVEKDVWEWWTSIQDEFLADTPGVYYTTMSSSDLTGGESRRQLDVFVKRRGSTPGMIHDWKDVRVIGEHRVSNHEWRAKLLQLGTYVRDIFSTQCTRRFVHAFTILGSVMELWVFDRAGPFSSGTFDIHEKPDRFVQAIIGYTMMTDEELGLDTFFQWDNEKQFITITEDITETDKTIELELKPIIISRAIVCRGTTCFRSKDSEYVVKFSWTNDKRPLEANHLRLARQKGVKGVAKLVGYKRITSIAEMRDGLTFPKPYRFRTTSANSLYSSSRSQVQVQPSLARAVGPPQGRSATELGSRKRKSSDARVGSLKRSKSNGQRSRLNQEVDATHVPNAQSPGDRLYDNRLLSCLVISPAGRVISDFTSIDELLRALRDAIRAHRSLYVDGGILHRDISENNIIITEPSKADGFSGTLIDLDLAKEINSGPSGAQRQTGTMEFMAIEVLRGVDHTYRHDLESFFYVLLWSCARRSWEREFKCRYTDRPRQESMLRAWYTGGYIEIARNKEHAMGVNGFKELLSEIPEALDCVKPLCREIRGILFPYKDLLFIGTPSDPKELYDPIIQAFDDSIQGSSGW